MKNKKGFTLVELLAVIVILGVLLLIAVPSITGVIENSRKNSFVSSVNMVVDQIKSQVSIAEIGDTIYNNVVEDEGHEKNNCYVDMTKVALDRGKLEADEAVAIITGTQTKSYTVYVNGTRGYNLSGDKIGVNNFETEKTEISISDADVLTLDGKTYAKCDLD